MQESQVRHPVSRHDFMLIGAVGTAAAAIETAKVVNNIKTAGKIIEFASPFDFTPLSPEWEANTHVETNLPSELWGVSVNAFGIWEAEVSVWDKLIRIMDKTGANQIRISTLSGGFFNRNRESEEKISKIESFLEYIKQLRKNGKDIRITFDFFDGFSGFQSDKFNATYTKQEICSPVENKERQDNKYLFFADKEINEEFKSTMKLYVDRFAKYDFINALTIANEIEPFAETQDGIDKLNNWYLDKIRFLRKILNDKKAIITGLADPTLIDPWHYPEFYQYEKLVHSLHWYPGKPLLIHKIKNLLTLSPIPVIFQEGGFPDEIDVQAWLPHGCDRNEFFSNLYEQAEGKTLDLPEDIFVPGLFRKAIKESTWGNQLLMAHYGFWGGWLNHRDGFLLDPDTQPQTVKLMQTLSRKLIPVDDRLDIPVEKVVFQNKTPAAKPVFAFA